MAVYGTAPTGTSQHRSRLRMRKTDCSSHFSLLDPPLHPLAVAGGALAVNTGDNTVAINFAVEHFRLELASGKVQPVASDSSGPAKVRAVLVRKCLLKPSPPPDACSQLHACTLVHTHSLCSSPQKRGSQSDAALHQDHTHVPKSRTPQQLRSTPKAQSGTSH